MTTPTSHPVRALGRRDAYPRTMMALVGVVLLGFAMIALGTKSVRLGSNPALQLPGLVSGCVAGIGLVAVGCGLATALQRRRHEADVRQTLERVASTADALLDQLSVRAQQP